MKSQIHVFSEIHPEPEPYKLPMKDMLTIIFILGVTQIVIFVLIALYCYSPAPKSLPDCPEPKPELEALPEIPLTDVAHYIDIWKRITNVDSKLLKLAENYPDQSFVHPKANRSFTEEPFGPLMKTPKELLFATHFNFDIRRPCGGNYGKDKTLVVFVYNQMVDVEKRTFIRSTFGASLRHNEKTEIYFLVAMQNDSKMQATIEHESAIYNDIIQVAYPEAYFNCTIKGIAMLRWTALHCPFTKFLLKLDDDTFVRVNPMLNELEQTAPTALYGHMRMDDPVIRDKTIKWYISPLYYPDAIYPNHIAGVYFIPGQFTVKLYEMIVSEPQIDTLPALPIDDVYITGILAKKAEIPVLYSNMIIQMDYYNASRHNLDDYSIFLDSLELNDLKNFWAKYGLN